MTTDRATEWWRGSAHLMGLATIEKTIAGPRDWHGLLAGGRDDLRRVIALTGMRTGKDLACLEIGCGVGRLTFALADYFGFVLGTDVSQPFLDRAAARNTRRHVVFELADGVRIRPRCAT